MKQKVMIESICFLLVLLFVYAAFSKLLDYDTFKFQLFSSPIIKTFAGTLAWFIPSIELIVAILLTVKSTRKYGLWMSLLLLLLFAFYITSILFSGIPLPCSCGGIICEFDWKQHIVFNLFFIALSATGIFLLDKQKRQEVDSNPIRTHDYPIKIFRANKEVS